MTRTRGSDSSRSIFFTRMADRSASRKRDFLLRRAKYYTGVGYTP